jgi:exodeoxyribonuclease VII small subunit
MSAKNDKSKTLNEQLQELEELIAWFEGDDIDLEEAISKFEQGSELAGEIKGRLHTLENKITVLKERFET